MNRFRRQSSIQVNQDQESIYIGYTTAVAAAAFAIHSHEEAEALKIGNKKGDTIVKLSHSSEVTSRFSFKKTKNGGENLSRQSTKQNHEALERTNSARKPIRSSSNKLKAPEDARKKTDRDEKLKSILAWANVKKLKAKHNMQSKKICYLL